MFLSNLYLFRLLSYGSNSMFGKRYQSFRGTSCLNLHGKEPQKWRQQVPPNHWYSKLNVIWHIWGLGVPFTSIHRLQIRNSHGNQYRVKTACFHFSSGMGKFLCYIVNWWMTDFLTYTVTGSHIQLASSVMATTQEWWIVLLVVAQKTTV